MSYAKMMKRTQGHRHDKDFQTIFHNAFNGENNIKSRMYYAEEALKRTNNCCIRVFDYNGDFTNIPLNFKTEDEAIDYIRDNNLENRYCHGEIITENDLVLSKW